MNPDDLIKNQNIVTRFVTEFGLEKEMLLAQQSINQVILGVNNFIEPGNPGVNEINRIGVASDNSQQGSVASAPAGASPGGGGAGLAAWLNTIPQAVGAAAVAAIKFITPSPTPAPNRRVDVDPYAPSTYSEIKPMVDVNQLVFGVLGVAALGTVGYSVYAAKSKTAKRRIYQRSVPLEGDEESKEFLWKQVGKAILKGKPAKKLHVSYKID